MIHPAAIVESDRVGQGTRVWPFAHVLAGAIVGADCNVGEHCFIESGAVVGDAVTLKNGVSVWDGVTLEDGVFVGPGVVFTNDRHPRSPRFEAAGSRYEDRSWIAPTRICRGATLGAAAVVLPGVTVGEFAFVAAAALVTRDVPPFALVRGRPARVTGRVCRCGRPVDAGAVACADCEAAGPAATAPARP